MITLNMVKGHNGTLVDAVIRAYSRQAGEVVNITATVENGVVVTNVAATLFGYEPVGPNVFTAEAGDRFIIDGTVHVLTDDDPWAYPALRVAVR